MRLRTLGRTCLQVSEIGLGCEHLQGQSAATVREVVEAALSAGINIFDVFMSEPDVRTHIGQAIAGRHDQVILQGHLGATWIDGQYVHSSELKQCKIFFEDFRQRLQADVVDIGMIHFIDTEEDYTRAFAGGLADYACQLKAQGIIRAVGLSSHNPIIARRAVETGLIDVLMFSLNPAFDIVPAEVTIDGLFTPVTFQDDSLCGINSDRADLYKTCELMGTGITVMKSLAAGILLQEDTSPFGKAMTVHQCIHYALTRPAVASVLVGCRSAGEVEQAVAYEQADDRDRDYMMVLSQTPKFSLKGHCVYCNHCLPCPARIDIAQVNKYLDLALIASTGGSSQIPDTLRAHYQALQQRGEDCIACGSCEQACPFAVPVIDRMRQAAELLGQGR